MTNPALPFQPFRQSLYTPAELAQGLAPADPASLTRTPDFAIYRYWVKKGRYKPQYFDGMMQSLHDNSISQCVGRLVAGRKVVGIMGGHADRRDSPHYRDVARLAHLLTENGYFITSGGGPGMMEAAHLGASYGARPRAELDAALGLMAGAPEFPAQAGALVDRHGRVDAAVSRALFAWCTPIFAVREKVDKPAESLGVPTWRYGHEPTCLFATHIAKYFENSVREDGLLSIARNGVIYAKGGAGTLQEIFQDAVFNAYFDDGLPPSPMVFFDSDYWARVPVVPVLKALFTPEDFDRFVFVTDDEREILAILNRFAERRTDAPATRKDAVEKSLAVSCPVLGDASLEPTGWEI